MTQREPGLRRQATVGIAGGLAGGFGVMMAMMGTTPVVASMSGRESSAVGKHAPMREVVAGTLFYSALCPTEVKAIHAGAPPVRWFSIQARAVFGI